MIVAPASSSSSTIRSTSMNPSISGRSEEHTSELQSRQYLVCRLLLEKKKNQTLTRRLFRLRRRRCPLPNTRRSSSPCTHRPQDARPLRAYSSRNRSDGHLAPSPDQYA